MPIQSDPVVGYFRQDCQMEHFQTKNPNLGTFWRDLKWAMLVYVSYCHLVYFTAILWPFGIFFPFWYFVPRKI
jgi:hypothetical protein